MTTNLAYRMGMTQLRLNPRFTSAQLVAEYSRLTSLHGSAVAESYLSGAFNGAREIGIIGPVEGARAMGLLK